MPIHLESLREELSPLLAGHADYIVPYEGMDPDCLAWWVPYRDEPDAMIPVREWAAEDFVRFGYSLEILL
jgi:hypothetical protein